MLYKLNHLFYFFLLSIECFWVPFLLSIYFLLFFVSIFDHLYQELILVGRVSYSINGDAAEALTEAALDELAAIVEEASATLHHTAHTTFTKLVQDYQCSIATVDGDMFAYPIQSGVNVFMGLPIRPMIEIIGIENMRPGDCYITNDPFGTDGLVTHLMDVTTLRPIFHENELIAFSWAFIHASDIGGGD